MTQNLHVAAQEVLDVTLSVGEGDLSVTEALAKLEEVIANAFDLTGITEFWQGSLKGGAIIVILYPELKDVFGTDDPRTPRKREVIPSEIIIKLIVGSALIAVSHFDSNSKRQQGAENLLSKYPSPIPESEAPFADGMFGNYRGSPDDH